MLAAPWRPKAAESAAAEQGDITCHPSAVPEGDSHPRPSREQAPRGVEIGASEQKFAVGGRKSVS